MYRRSAAGVLGLLLLGLLSWQFLLIPTQANAGLPAPRPAPRPAASGDWPMYGHDAQRTNYNPAETLLGPQNVAQWVPRWQADIGLAADGTPSFSAPSVAAGQLVVGSSVATGPNLFSFDAGSGAALWSADVGHVLTSCFGVGIGSTAAISGTTVVVGGGDAAYYGLSAQTGAIRWRNPLDVGPSGFAWTSPLLAAGQAYVGVASDCDNPSVRGELRALDPSSGQLQANQYFVPSGEAGGGVWNSPALSPDGHTLVVATGEDDAAPGAPYARAMIALDPQTLAIQAWNQQGDPNLDEDWGTTPIIFGDSQGRTLVGANEKNGTFYAYDLTAIGAGPIWSRGTGTRVGMMPAYDPTFGPGGTLFIAGEDENWVTSLYTVDPATGQDRRPPQPIGILNGNLALANGLILLNVAGAGPDPARLLVLDEQTGAPLRTITPDHAGHAFSGPVVANGMVYWLSGAYLNAWSLPDPNSPSPTPLPSATPVASPTACPISFSDVPPDNPFYAYVRCLACRGIVSGYADGTFRPAAAVTRGQLAKIIAGAGGLSTPIASTEQKFADVPPDQPFWLWVERLSIAGAISGYQCGGPGEPCDAQRRPYYRPASEVTRGQLAKIDALVAELPNPLPSDHQTFADVLPTNPFWRWIEQLAGQGIISGYQCGGPDEPCDAQQRPYFRWGATTTRAQLAKIAAQTFFPGC